MSPEMLTELLELTAGERADLAMALWDSLDDAERETEVSLSDDQQAAMDQRFAEHLENPASAIPWNDIRRKLTGAE